MTEKRVACILRDLGVPVHILGYEYLCKGLHLVTEDRTMLRAITSRLYPAVAERFATTPSRVERAIRYAIETAWLRSTPEAQELYFGRALNYDTGKPTNWQFIATICDALALEEVA